MTRLLLLVEGWLTLIPIVLFLRQFQPPPAKGPGRHKFGRWWVATSLRMLAIGYGLLAVRTIVIQVFHPGPDRGPWDGTFVVGLGAVIMLAAWIHYLTFFYESRRTKV